MSTPITFNGVSYSVPAYNDTGYAQGAGNLSAYLIAIATGTLQQTGGTFSLLADVDFGMNFGIKAKYLISETVNPATNGVLRLAKTDSIEWRNNANGGNLPLAIDGSDRLTYNGSPIVTGGSTGNLTDVGTDGIVITGGTGAVIGSGTSIAQHVADASHNGYLSSTDWTTFNNKQPNLGTLTAHDVLVGAGGSSVSLVSPGTANLALVSNGVSLDPSFQAVVNSIAGTTNQVIASAATGAVTLSLPQDIATTSSPTFSNVTISNDINMALNGVITSTQAWSINSGSVLHITGAPITTNGEIVPASSNTNSLGSSSKHYANAHLNELVMYGATSGNLTFLTPSTITSYNVTLPSTQGGASTFLSNDGAGNLTWASPAGSGTVNSGTATHLAYYATTTNAVSDANGQTLSGTYTLSGGAGALTMSSSTIAMGSNKITGLANGSASTDAAAFGQILPFVAPTIQTLTSASGTYTTPTSPRSPLYLRVRMVGGGGGGSGGGTSANVGGSGTNTVFGSATANGGGGGAVGTTGGTGGSNVTTPFVVINIPGGQGEGSNYSLISGSGQLIGGTGGSTPFGSGAKGQAGTIPAGRGGTGEGGAGGTSGTTGANNFGGTGGGGGGYLELILTSPSATYSYSVGTSGGAGGSSTAGGGTAGSAGGLGIIIVEEHYQ